MIRYAKNLGGNGPLTSPRYACAYLTDTFKFNQCVQNGIFPDKLKLTKIIPVFKSIAKDTASS